MRVLLVRLSALGDLVHGLGPAQALATARPDLELHLVTQREFAPVLAGSSWLTSLIAHDRTSSLRGLWRTRAKLRALSFDVALDLQGNWKSAVVARLSGAERRIGAGAAGRREPGSARLLTERVDVPSRHPAVVALSVVRALAPAATESPSRLVATDEEIRREAEAVRALGVDPDQPFRVLVVSSGGDPRTWPVSAMAREAALDGPPAIWLAGPAEASLAGLEAHRVLWHGRGELRRLVALGHVAARAGATVIGPDRGATHVLAACGVATTAMFGPQDPALTAPLAARVLQRVDGPDCVPCRRRTCDLPEGPICMEFTSREAR